MLLSASVAADTSAPATTTPPEERLTRGEETDTQDPAEERGAGRREPARARMPDERAVDQHVLAMPERFIAVALPDAGYGNDIAGRRIGEDAPGDRFGGGSDLRRQDDGAGVAQLKLRLATDE